MHLFLLQITLKHAFQIDEITKFWRTVSCEEPHLKDSNSATKPAPFPLQLLIK